MYRAQTDDQPMLGKELLSHDVAIATMLEKRCSQPLLKAIKETRPPWRLVGGVAASFQVAFDRVAGQAKLTRDLPAAKTKSVQLHDPADLFRLQHPIPPAVSQVGQFYVSSEGQVTLSPDTKIPESRSCLSNGATRGSTPVDIWYHI